MEDFLTGVDSERRLGAKTGLIIGIVVALVAIGIVVYYYGSQSSTSGVTTTTSTAPVPDLKIAFENHLATIGARNISAVLEDYQDNAVVVWSGSTEGLGGVYSGVGNIRILFASALSTSPHISFTPSSIQQFNGSGSLVTVNSTVSFKGKSNILGAFNGTLKTDTAYANTNGGWRIVKEHWNYTTFNVSASGGATTFPEWQKVGPVNDSRRSTDWLHNFVWDYGGYVVAAMIYAFIMLIAVISLARRNRRRYPKDPQGPLREGWFNDESE